jgi:hypothetical protein
MRPALVVPLFLLWVLWNATLPRNRMTMRLYDSYADTARDHSLRALYELEEVEYPPLSVALMIGVSHAADLLAPVWRPFHREEPGSRGESAEIFGRTWCLLGYGVQALVLLGLLRMLRRMFPEEGGSGQARRLLTWLVASIFLSKFLFPRLDATMAAIVLASLALLLRGSWVSSFLALAVAIDFKLVPAVLAPLWLFASLPKPLLAGRTSRLVAPLLGRAALLAGFVVLLALPFVVAGGPRSLRFLAFHAERGIQCESTYAGILLLLRLFGHPVVPRGGFGSWELHSPLAEALVPVSTVLLLLGLGLAHLLAVRALRRGADDGAIIAATVLLLMISAGLSKVFSSQYALWVVPLVPLLPTRGRARLRYNLLFLVACLLTTYLFQNFSREATRGDPAPVTTAMLLARSAIWLGLAGWLASGLRKEGWIGRLSSEPRL